MKKLIVPGDKSITQRFLILAGVAEGKSLLRGALASTDCFSTADTLQKLGVQITNEPDKDEFTILGAGLQGFRNPECKGFDTLAGRHSCSLPPTPRYPKVGVMQVFWNY